MKAFENTADPKKLNVVKTTPLKMNFVGGTKLTSTGTEEKVKATEAAATTTESVTESSEQEVPVEGTPIGKVKTIYT